jgi:predicted transcriptional regulator
MMVFEQDNKKSDRSNSSTRERMQITADILHHCTEIKMKSQVMQKAKLNFDQVNQYLGNLLSRGLLEQAVAAEGGSRIYRTTEKGRKFLVHYHDMMQLFKDRFSSKQNKNGHTTLNESKKLVISRPRKKILAISFLLAVSLSMMVANSLPTITTTTVSQKQQLAYAEQQETKVFATGADGAAHELKLRAIKQSDGQIQKIGGFKISAENVVQINQGNDIVIFTNPDQNIDKVKVRDSNNKLIELAKIAEHVYSLAGYPVGVYALDVIVDNRAYETILVIIPANQAPIIINQEIITRINQVINRVEIEINGGGGGGNGGGGGSGGNGNGTQGPDRDCFFAPDLPKCAPIDGRCPDGFGFNEDGQCIPHGDCPDGYSRVDDDETGKCFSDDKLKECEGGGHVLIGDRCWNDPPENLPVCDGSTQRCVVQLPGGSWHICEIGTTDHECEIEEPEPQPEIVAPDGGPVRMCLQDMSVGSIACREGKTVEQVCEENPGTQGCGENTETQPVTPGIGPLLSDPGPAPVQPALPTPEPEPEPILDDSGDEPPSNEDQDNKNGEGAEEEESDSGSEESSSDESGGDSGGSATEQEDNNQK